MPKAKLQDINLPRLPAGMHWDTLLPAFGVRVQKTARTFLVVQSGGHRIKLGRYPALSLAQAREKARGLMSGPAVRPGSFSEVLDVYVDQHLKKNCRPSTARELERLLRHDFPLQKAMSQITKADIVAVIDLIEGQSAANHATAAIKTLFNWAEQKGYLDRNPIAKLPKPYRDKSRERILNDDELRQIWMASKKLGDFGALVRLCILTGQRRGELAALQENWIAGSMLTIPASATKNGREHRLPLPHLARSTALLTLARSTKRTSWSKPKARLDALCGVTGWTLHDLRRTFATRLAELATPPHVIERILNHAAPASLGGDIGAIYNRFQYLEEQRQALDAYEAHLSNIGCSLVPD